MTPMRKPRPEHPGCVRGTNTNAVLNEYDVIPRRRWKTVRKYLAVSRRPRPPLGLVRCGTSCTSGGI